MAPSSKEIVQVKGPWSDQEDEILKKLVEENGPRYWSWISRSIPGRTGKSCRLRWCNQLSPAVIQSPFTKDEDNIIIEAHAKFGNKWAKIAKLLEGRSDNVVKNRWNSTLHRRLTAEREPEGEPQDPQVSPVRPNPKLVRSDSVEMSIPNSGLDCSGLGLDGYRPVMADEMCPLPIYFNEHMRVLDQGELDTNLSLSLPSSSSSGFSSFDWELDMNLVEKAPFHGDYKA